MTCFGGVDILTGLGVGSPEALTPVRGMATSIGSPQSLVPAVSGSEQAGASSETPYVGEWTGTFLGSQMIVCYFWANDPYIYDVGTVVVQGAANVNCSNAVPFIELSVMLYGSTNGGANWYPYAGPTTVPKPNTSSLAVQTDLVPCVPVLAQSAATVIITPPPAYVSAVLRDDDLLGPRKAQLRSTAGAGGRVHHRLDQLELWL